MQYIDISKLKTNVHNPRFIKDEKYKKLVKSIQDFPEMLEVRPIVVNADMTVLGGNMRLRASKEAGLKEIPVVIREDWTEEQQAEFIIKDNVSHGEWDWEVLANEWEEDFLSDWMTDFSFKYEPTLDPSFNFNDVTAQDIEKKQGELESRFEQGKEMLNVTCPHCGEEYFIEK